MSLPQMRNLGVSLDLQGSPERILFHTGFLKGQGVPLHRNRAGHLTLNVMDICRKAKASSKQRRAAPVSFIYQKVFTVFMMVLSKTVRSVRRLSLHHRDRGSREAKGFGDVVFMDHFEIKHTNKKHQLFLVLDGVTSLLWGATQEEGREPITQNLFVSGCMCTLVRRGGLLRTWPPSPHHG